MDKNDIVRDSVFIDLLPLGIPLFFFFFDNKTNYVHSPIFETSITVLPSRSLGFYDFGVYAVEERLSIILTSVCFASLVLIPLRPFHLLKV